MEQEKRFNTSDRSGVLRIVEVFSSDKRADTTNRYGGRMRFRYNRVKIQRITSQGVEEIWRSDEFPAKWKTQGSKGGRAWACAEVIVLQLLAGKLSPSQNLPPAQRAVEILSGRRLIVMSGGGDE
jgi:hypothetical protein